ncbi:MAG: biotin--[acetyl-CoA-carboxylase] ligase [Syntrophomonadaceae bacterium]|nr:biotin--[acetyl-CoA-carboxylase] ligase [Syntrophomonadaceae bacterium]
MRLREAVLGAIREEQGQWVSGERLSMSLKVSRTTIWKQIKILQSEGYAIESSPKKGYRLSMIPDILSPEEVKDGLQTQLFGREHYYYFKEIDSTNNYAKTLAADGHPEGTVVIAESQSSGRGRRGRQWYSDSGQGIFLSLILRPPLPVNELSRINMAIALAIVDALQEVGIKSGIKWPNDILIKDRKIAGILTEAITDMDGIEFIVSGIGLNVNTLIEDFPAELRPIVTSVREEAGRMVSRVHLLQILLLKLEQRYQQLISGAFTEILEQVRTLSLVIGRDITIKQLGGITEGRAIDIDNNGFLLVRDGQGNIHHLMSGEVLLKPQ